MASWWSEVTSVAADVSVVVSGFVVVVFRWWWGFLVAGFHGGGEISVMCI